MLSSSSSSSSPSTSSQQQSKPPRASKPDSRGGAGSSSSRWRTPGQQRVYNRRLLDALRSPAARRPVSARAVKDAADSALALTARGQSRWSRAILTGRRNKVLVKTGGKVRRKKPRKPAKKLKVLAADEAGETSKERKVKERLRRLGRLVPGCGKLPAPSLLEETADYVAALEMQVKAMRALAEALSAATLSPPPEETEEETGEEQGN